MVRRFLLQIRMPIGVFGFFFFFEIVLICSDMQVVINWNHHLQLIGFHQNHRKKYVFLPTSSYLIPLMNHSCALISITYILESRWSHSELNLFHHLLVVFLLLLIIIILIKVTFSLAVFDILTVLLALFHTIVVM
jgi:hypothetical protein